VIPIFKVYIELEPHNEMYEISQPVVSAHNLIIGTLYLDIGGKSIIRKCGSAEYTELDYHRRGWSSSNSYRVDGEVFNKKKEAVYKLEGKWDSGASMTNIKSGKKEEIWKKNPYHEKWDYMYGYSNFVIQLNYLPNFLKRVISPTDTRWRPD
jgi:hypothetical protein